MSLPAPACSFKTLFGLCKRKLWMLPQKAVSAWQDIKKDEAEGDDIKSRLSS